MLTIVHRGARGARRDHSESSLMEIRANSALPILGILLLPACRGGAGVPAYVGGTVCSECHATEAAAWTGSHHDLTQSRR